MATKVSEIISQQLDDVKAIAAYKESNEYIGAIQQLPSHLAENEQEFNSRAINVIGYEPVLDGVTDNTAKVQLAVDDAETAGGGLVFVPNKCKYNRANITYKANVTILDNSDGQFNRVILNGENVSGAVSEFIVEGGYHPAYILDVYDNRVLDTLAIETDQLTITAVPTSSGNIIVTLNGVAVNIAVDPATDTTTDAVATKIRNTAFAGWTTSGTGSIVIFTANDVGFMSAPVFSGGTTGVTGTFARAKTGQGYSHRASYLIRVNGIGKWQFGNDCSAENIDGYTIYNIAKNRQAIYCHPDGNTAYGQNAAQDYTAPLYPHVFRGGIICMERDAGQNVSFIMRTKDNVARKILTMNGTTGNITIDNNASNAVIIKLKDNGNFYAKTGVSGGYLTTAQIKALTATDATAVENGTMIVASDTGKILGYHGANVWKDAMGTQV